MTGNNKPANKPNKSRRPHLRTPKPKQNKKTDAGAKNQPKAAKQSGLGNMQKNFGNQAVQRAVVQRSGGEQAFKLNQDVSKDIKRESGSGHPIDGVVQEKLGKSLGHDLSDVRIHTDQEADNLNRQVNAKAFTVGKDIFFRRGEYDPHSTDGQELLAHEATHVVDQSQGQVKSEGSGMTVHAPNDVHEQRADEVAKEISGETDNAKQQYVAGQGMESNTLQRQGVPEEMQMKALQRQDDEELETKALQRQDEEEVEMKALQRQDEEEVEMKAVQRQDEEEVEMKAVQRQDDEELETKALQRQDDEELETKALQRQDDEEVEMKKDRK